MNNISIVVGSVYPDIFAVCKESVDRFAGKFRRIVVVDENEVAYREPAVGKHDVTGWELRRITDPPGIFPRLINVGFAAASLDDVLLLADDVQLLGSDVDRLRQIAYSDERIGMLCPRVYGSCGNSIQSSQGKQSQGDWIETKQRLIFAANFLKRAVIDQVGSVDERFTGYGGDDTDYSRRIQQAGFILAVASRISVKHGFGELDGSASWHRHGPDGIRSHVEMQKLLDEKWGGHNGT